MESYDPLVESDERHQNEANPFEALDGIDHDAEDADD